MNSLLLQFSPKAANVPFASHRCQSTEKDSGARISYRWRTRAASWWTCCKQIRWVLTVIILWDRAKLTTLHIESRQFSATAPTFNLPTCIWRLHWGWPRLSSAAIFGVRKRVPGLSWHSLRDPTFSHFSRTPTCDKQTDRHTTIANTCAIWHHNVGKNHPLVFLDSPADS